jgi:hypothetical protein
MSDFVHDFPNRPWISRRNLQETYLGFCFCQLPHDPGNGIFILDQNWLANPLRAFLARETALLLAHLDDDWDVMLLAIARLGRFELDDAPSILVARTGSYSARLLDALLESGHIQPGPHPDTFTVPWIDALLLSRFASGRQLEHLPQQPLAAVPHRLRCAA